MSAWWRAIPTLARMVRVREHRELAKLWMNVFEQFNALSREFEREERAAGEIGAGLGQGLRRAQRNWIAAQGKQHGHFRDSGHGARRGPAGHGEVDVRRAPIRQ